jgi:hypothetical protein
MTRQIFDHDCGPCIGSDLEVYLLMEYFALTNEVVVLRWAQLLHVVVVIYHEVHVLLKRLMRFFVFAGLIFYLPIKYFMDRSNGSIIVTIVAYLLEAGKDNFPIYFK